MNLDSIRVTSTLYNLPHYKNAEDRLLVTEVDCSDCSDCEIESNISLTILVDCSGSMCGVENQLKGCLLTIDDILRKITEIKINLVFFSNDAELVHSGILDDSYRKTVEKIKCAGMTNYEAALSCAIKSKHNAPGYHFAIMLTDGRPTVGKCRYVTDICRFQEKLGDFCAVGLGKDINLTLLSRLGEFVFINSVAECPEVFGSILGSVLNVIGYDGKIDYDGIKGKNVIGDGNFGRLFPSRKYMHAVSILTKDIGEMVGKKTIVRYTSVKGENVKIVTTVLGSCESIPDDVLVRYYDSSATRLIRHISICPQFVEDRLKLWYNIGKDAKSLVNDFLAGTQDLFEYETLLSTFQHQIGYNGLTSSYHTSNQDFFAENMTTQYSSEYNSVD